MLTGLKFAAASAIFLLPFAYTDSGSFAELVSQLSAGGLDVWRG